jgi:hypothetical protein
MNINSAFSFTRGAVERISLTVIGVEASDWADSIDPLTSVGCVTPTDFVPEIFTQLANAIELIRAISELRKDLGLIIFSLLIFLNSG